MFYDGLANRGTVCILGALVRVLGYLTVHTYRGVSSYARDFFFRFVAAFFLIAWQPFLFSVSSADLLTAVDTAIYKYIT